MFDDTGLQILELAGRGYCCSQIMVSLALGEMGRGDPDLVRAAAGLCNGMGDCSGLCGVFSGAALVLGLHAGRGTDAEEADDRLALMLEELRDWFLSATEQYGGTSCRSILSGECGQPDQARCGGLLADASARVREILADNGFDPAQGR
jgi:hypothetical protein